MLLGFISFQAKAQQANHFNSWWIYSANFRMHDQFSVNAMYAWSRNDFVKNWQQSLAGFGLNYYHKRNVEFGAGYEWIERFPYGEQPLPNQISIHRFFQKITVKNKIGNVGITNVIRFNQEYINADFRYFIINHIGLKIPIQLNSKNTKLSIRFTEGIIINHGKWVTQSYFGQNRAYVGLNVLIRQSIGVDLGYLNHYIIKENQLTENNHTLFFKLTHNLDFRKKISNH